MSLLAATALLFAGSAHAQQQPSSSELLRDLEHLRVVGSVLYVAAHPDDENTRLLAWMVGERGLDATYLSLTRGGGGQNLIGTEQSELLGVVRTGELLAARSIDGAAQRFTRARDFGYSKSAEEALTSWGHDEVLSDVVRAVRELKPDVIITRFGPDDDTHGHHVASAILAAEAFTKASDPTYPGSILAPWKVDRIVRNESHWRIGPDTDTSGWLSVDVGGYDAHTGRSWGEVAADSRTMHKSQGFGSAPAVGPQPEFFSAVGGRVPSPGQDLFEGLDFTWARFPGTRALDQTLAHAVERFDPRDPSRSLPELARAHGMLKSLDVGPWDQRKTAELEEVMAACAGLWLTARSEQPAVAPGGALKITVDVLPRGAPIELHRVRIEAPNTKPVQVEATTLAAGTPWKTDLTVQLDPTTPPSQPHWLAEPPGATLYTLKDRTQRTAADTPASLQAVFDVTIGGRRFELRRPVQYAWTDRVAGERTHAVEVLPPVTATFGQRARLVPNKETVTASVTLRAEAGAAAGVLRLTPPAGGRVEPSEVTFSLTAEQPEQVVELKLTAGPERGALTAEVEVAGLRSSLARAVIDHPHLPRRTVLQKSTVDVVPLRLEYGKAGRIAYLMGPGDEVAHGLRDLGYDIDVIGEDVPFGDLSGYDTVVLGIRALNTRPELYDRQQALLDWVAKGGRLVVQYNTSGRGGLRAFGPAPFEVQRDRVTDQNALFSFVDPEEPMLRDPNLLLFSDFDGWVQERGLYFAHSWDPAYRPVFRLHDPGEEPLEGSVLIAEHGKGVFVYTGLSFFRQLPAGVPGAARMLANLLAVEPAR